MQTRCNIKTIIRTTLPLSNRSYSFWTTSHLFKDVDPSYPPRHFYRPLCTIVLGSSSIANTCVKGAIGAPEESGICSIQLFT